MKRRITKPRANKPRVMKLCPTLSMLCVAMLPLGAFAGENDQPSTTAPGDWSFWTAGQLPTEWDTRAGTDLNLGSDQPVGSAWSSVAVPSGGPLAKSPFETRFEGAKDDSKVGATLSRSVPLGSNVSVTWQNSYALTQPVTPAAPTSPYVSQYGFISPTGIVGQSTENREVDQSLRFKIAPSGTTFSAGTATSATDTQWHNRLSLEQALPGSLNVTTSVEDAGTGASRKSITAGFKKVW
jgi:hypothetical protein